jgi:hypothetical protein
MMVDMVCDIEGCNDQAAEVITYESETSNDCFGVNMCPFHYSDFMSDESTGKPVNIKNVPVQERQN